MSTDPQSSADGPQKSEGKARLVIGRDHFPAVSEHLTATVASQLPFHVLVPYKNLLKRYFSAAPWTNEDAQRLCDLVTPHLAAGHWVFTPAPGLLLEHGVGESGYSMRAEGAAEAGTEASLFERAFSGPVVPEPTPHPQKVKFTFGGTPGPGLWYLQGEPVPDARVEELLGDPGITDVMLAGDFVTIGLAPGLSWRDHLDHYVTVVAELFATGDGIVPPSTTRDEMLHEAGTSRESTSGDLHLANPDDTDDRDRLLAAMTDPDPRRRRIAVAVLVESSDAAVREGAVRGGFADERLSVRRTAVDGARDEGVRDVLETALTAEDPWIRWRAVRNLADVGLTASIQRVAPLQEDPDFQVRFEVARALREATSPRP